MISEELRRHYLDTMGIQVWQWRDGAALEEGTLPEGVSESPSVMADLQAQLGGGDTVKPARDSQSEFPQTIKLPPEVPPSLKPAARSSVQRPVSPPDQPVISSVAPFRLLLVSSGGVLAIADLPAEPVADGQLAGRIQRFIENVIFAFVGEGARDKHTQEFCWPPSRQTPEADRTLAVAIEALALPLQKIVTASSSKRLLILGEWSARCCGLADGPGNVIRQRVQLTANHQIDGIIAPAIPLIFHQPELKKTLWQSFIQAAGE